jgi:hypothetical protein
VDPAEHDGERVDEADEDFEDFLHACTSPGFGGRNPQMTSRRQPSLMQYRPKEGASP